MNKQDEIKKFNISFKNLSTKEKDRAINIFAWLIKEDKKQNPNLYKK